MKKDVSKFNVSVDCVGSEKFGREYLHALASSMAYRAAKRVGFDAMVKHGFVGIGQVKVINVKVVKSRYLSNMFDLRGVAVIEYRWR